MTWKEAKREMMFAKRNVLEGSYIDQAYDKAIEALSQPEIIRCRDCVWHDGNVCRNNDSIPWSDDDFCSNAERREVSE